MAAAGSDGSCHSQFFLIQFGYSLRCVLAISGCSIVRLPTHQDKRGSLTFVESAVHVPFHIRRVYYLHSSAGNLKRGVHAHKKLRQLIVSISGSFDVFVDDGFENKTYRLDKPVEGLLISGVIWREIINLSSNDVCLVLASELFDETDYVHDYDLFKQLVSKK